MTDMRLDAISCLEVALASLVRRLEANYHKRGYPMERAHYLLLAQLEGGAKSTGEIAETFGLDHSTVVRQVAAVEARQFVVREPNPRDRRSMLVRMTPEGAACLIEMRGQRRERLRRVLADWSESECAQFAGQLDRFDAALRNDLAQPVE